MTPRLELGDASSQRLHLRRPRRCLGLIVGMMMSWRRLLCHWGVNPVNTSRWNGHLMRLGMMKKLSRRSHHVRLLHLRRRRRRLLLPLRRNGVLTPSFSLGGLNPRRLCPRRLRRLLLQPSPRSFHPGRLRRSRPLCSRSRFSRRSRPQFFFPPRLRGLDSLLHRSELVGGGCRWGPRGARGFSGPAAAARPFSRRYLSRLLRGCCSGRHPRCRCRGGSSTGLRLQSLLFTSLLLLLFLLLLLLLLLLGFLFGRREHRCGDSSSGGGGGGGGGKVGVGVAWHPGPRPRWC